MSRELIAHIFGNIQTLERIAKECLELISGKGSKAEHQTLEQINKALRHMRRTANRLQFELATKDSVKATRSLAIFYGLNQMVRPEVTALYAGLNNAENPFIAIDSQAVFH